VLQRLIAAREDELPAVLWAFAYFFSLMCGYYVLRPLRDEMGIAGGTEHLPWLFTATFLTMLAVVPLYSAAVARFARSRLIPLVYRCFVFNLVAFCLLWRAGVARAHVAHVFFVWVSVYNLLAVSVFWSLMADLFSSEQARRLFAPIAAGGSAGALLGPLLTRQLAPRLGPTWLTLLAAVLLEVSLFCVRRLIRAVPARSAAVPAGDRPVGGGMLDGFVEVLRSPYLIGLAAQVLLYTVTLTFLYLEQANIVKGALAQPGARTRLFATIDLVANVTQLVLQLVLASHLLRRAGLLVTLAVLPVVTALGSAILWARPLLAVVVGYMILRRALHFAFDRPAREVLFTVLPRSEKYKAKGFIDTVGFRGGDALGGWIFHGLTALGVTTAGTALFTVPLAGLWLGVVALLSRAEARRRAILAAPAASAGGSGS
jgi:AAA family ATP:ADP antiporter